MEEEIKPKLVKGETYKIARFTFDSLIGEGIRATYLGFNRRTHIFSTKYDKDKEYFFLSDNWIIERRGIIDYTTLSSCKYYPYNKREIQGELQQILNELGEQI